ncbi:DUF6766 family protein [Streptomyces purpurogeneiscleroticus]|uniref:DUF6766 family protein n=1 Tax=Streptomyces purpurogeneiscleroticus TaxID=68259 RepID=UPI001CBCACA6|nr:DUF6766 family protein [Streptomyces purpurogeneiscleroticus]MBZ4015065.1 hypothetical protein [Streptomyces purpurogeneiscleroticus]
MNARRKFLRDNSLGIFFGAAFVAALIGQAFAGQAEYNNQLTTQDFAPVGFWTYVSTSDFAVDVLENWQSEYLQFFLYIFLTVWLVQRGSPESKSVDRRGRGTEKEQRMAAYAHAASPRWASIGGVRQWVFSQSLGLMMGAVFVLSWLAQSISGASAYNETRLQDRQPPVSWSDYLFSAEFWSRTLQNWQSELLAIASMVVLSIYLRQRGSPESKPVGAPHSSTGVEG